MSSNFKKPNLIVSLVPVVVLITLLVINIFLFNDNAALGPNQVTLFVAAAICAFIGIFHLQIPYKDIEKRIIHSIGLSMQANLILLVVGTLIALWIFNGVVPAMIYYGIKLFNPNWFLPLACVVCCVVSMATGSSWSTGGTVGIAFIGVGQALNIPTPMVAGAVISGAYFGDKLSPLSDTTNLAPAMAGVDLFTHIRYMLFTTLPSFAIALIGFSILGYFYGGAGSDIAQVNEFLNVLESRFNLSPFLFLLPGLVFFMVAKKIPALPALLMGCFLGVVFGLVFQQDLLKALIGPEMTWLKIYGKIIELAHSGFFINTNNEMIDSLLNRGGMSSMLNTVWLILMAMVFGGVMEVTGMLEEIGNAILKMVKGTGSLIAATVSSTIVVNLTASDQYLSVVLPGRMFRASYRKFGLAPQNLSRSLEDGGTLTSVLVPWNTCGAYFSTILGVSTLSYLPFCFFNLINPIVSIVIGASGWKIEKLNKEESAGEEFINAPELG